MRRRRARGEPGQQAGQDADPGGDATAPGSWTGGEQQRPQDAPAGYGSLAGAGQWPDQDLPTGSGPGAGAAPRPGQDAAESGDTWLRPRQWQGGPQRGWPAYGDQDSAQPQPFGSSGRYPSPLEQWPPGHGGPGDPGSPPGQEAAGSGQWSAPPGQAAPAARGAGPETAGPVPPREGRGRRKRRTIVIVSLVAVLIAAAAAAGGGYLLLRTKGSPQETAAAFLGGWERRDYHAMNKLALGLPHGGVAGPLTAASEQLGVRSTRISPGPVTSANGAARARFTVTERLASNHTWRYHGVLRLVSKNRHWWVRWSPSVIYPGLKSGERFSLSSAWPARAQILGADGTVLSSPAALAQSGSLALLTGYVGPATKKQAKGLGAPYKAGDPVGQSGIQQTYQSQLAGSPSLTISLAGPGKRAGRVVRKFAAIPGQPVRTSIKMSAQLAASQAVLGASTTKPIDMVVIQPSTGRVLAMVERPGSWDRAIDGLYPPGSTFKIVTASALANQGMTPSSPVDCPSTVDIGGHTFHNDQNEQLGSTTLLKAFAISCNTTFAELAAQRLTGAKLAAMARQYGYNSQPALGIPATLGSFKLPADSTALAADAFGQGTDLVSPLSQAAEAAAAQSGTWRPPLLVVDPAPAQHARPHSISPSIIATLRPMMHAVVTMGTAAGVGFPSGVYGKTGTAEYDVGTKVRSHGWFIGYDGDLAFAVLVEGGGYGASSAGPVANAFLRHYYG